MDALGVLGTREPAGRAAVNLLGDDASQRDTRREDQRTEIGRMHRWLSSRGTVR